MKAARIISFAIALSVIGSCSIFENRDNCPCYVKVLSSNIPTDCEQVSAYFLESGNMTSKSDIPAEMIRTGYDIEMERKEINEMMLWCDTSVFAFPDFSVGDCHIVAPEGKDFPSVFMARENFSTMCDATTLHAVFHKRFARINVIFCTEITVEEAIICSDASGYTLSGEPIASKTKYNAQVEECEEGMEFSVNVPQQTSDGMLISLLYRGESVCVIPAGDILRKHGYDWKAADLSDIRLKINASDISVSIITAQWEDGFEGNKDI